MEPTVDVAPPPPEGEAPLATAIKRFAMLDSFSSSDGDGAAFPTNRLRFGAGGQADLSGLLDDSMDLRNSPPYAGSPARLALAKGAEAPLPASTVEHSSDWPIDSTAADAPLTHQELGPLRFPAADRSAGVAQRHVSRSSSSSSSSTSASAASAPRKQRGAATAESPASAPQGRPEQQPLLPAPTAVAVAPAPDTPRQVAAATTTGTPAPRQPRQTRTRIAATASPLVVGAAATPLQAIVPDAQPAAVAATSAAPVRSSASRSATRQRPGGAPSRVASAGTRPSPASPAPLSTPSLPQDVGREPRSPTSGRAYTTVPQWTRHMKKKDGVYVERARVANPTAMYDRGVTGLWRASAKREAMRAKLAEAALAEATFHPSISPRASALKRGSDAGHDAAAQLRYRLQLLELPDELATATHRHSPRLSHASEMIVRACRERGGGVALPPGERLYRDSVYRRMAIEAARPTAPPPAVVRSRDAIEAHIAGLYSFERQRQCAIAAAREAPPSLSAEAQRRVYVDPQALVERLTKEAPPSPRLAAVAQLERDQCPFQPRTNAGAAEMRHQARLRGLHRWVRHFCGADVLVVPVLLAYRGPAADEAAALLTLLQHHSPSTMEWGVDDLAGAVAARAGAGSLVAELWRRRPPGDEASRQNGDLLFRPTVNPKSAAIVDDMEAEQRCGPTHDRLFLGAKARQLSQRQHELEEEQAALEEGQRELLRRRQSQALWRAREAQRLAAYRAERETERRDSAAAAEALQRRQATPSRRLLLRSVSPPQETVVGRVNAAPSPAPRPRPVHVASASSTSRSPAPVTPPMAPSPLAPVCISGCDGGSGCSRTSAAPRAVASATTTDSVERHAPVMHARTTTAPLESGAPAMDAAAEALRQLLAAPTHDRTAASGAPTAPPPPPLSSSSVPASTCFAPCDLNRPRASSGQPRSCSRPLDVVLECAELRDPRTLPSSERERLARAQKRQLRELGRLLYNRHRSRVDVAATEGT
ncbi:hypothetical protein NESM_000881100 [Novymonas esmeraldas]|uniref:Uncharacterized protein n=1 Tax=Novymonas esmeraldas TaxID=1808958 RepID=A0AAW0EY95_9TRYP